MPAAPLIVAILVTVATISGAVVLAIDPAPLASERALLLTAGMALATVVAIAGILLARGRWAGRLGAVLAAIWVGTGARLEARIGIAVVLIGAAALSATSGPWLARWLRRLPTTGGVPPVAVVLLLTLLLTPSALALAGTGGIAAANWWFAAWSVTLALALARTVPGSLLLVRVVHPVVAVVAAVLAGLPEAVPMLASAAIVVLLAWRRDLAVALAPLVPDPGGVFRLPPELAPPEVLEAAGADESGRIREPG